MESPRVAGRVDKLRPDPRQVQDLAIIYADCHTACRGKGVHDVFTACGVLQGGTCGDVVGVGMGVDYVRQGEISRL